jgi:hypothetical protein
MLLAFVGYHQAPDRFKRTLDINLLELSMPPLPMWVHYAFLKENV